MRAAFASTVTRLMQEDDRIVLLLADIGAYAFRDAAKRWPDRVMNLGVCEQAIVGIAAGLAKEGRFPIVHTIAPFLALRALEFIRNGFGLQGLSGMFVTVGASFDYSRMGATHHCPEDCHLMSTVPGMRIYVPGCAGEVEHALDVAVNDGRLSYIRLSEAQHDLPPMPWAARPMSVCIGANTTVVAVGPTLSMAMTAAQYDANVVYVNRPVPLPEYFPLRTSRVLLVEPYYSGLLAQPIMDALYPEPLVIRCVGVPRGISEGYGTREDHEVAAGLTVLNIRHELEALIAA